MKSVAAISLVASVAAKEEAETTAGALENEIAAIDRLKEAVSTARNVSEIIAAVRQEFPLAQKAESAARNLDAFADKSRQADGKHTWISDVKFALKDISKSLNKTSVKEPERAALADAFVEDSGILGRFHDKDFLADFKWVLSATSPNDADQKTFKKFLTTLDEKYHTKLMSEGSLKFLLTAKKKFDEVANGAIDRTRSDPTDETVLGRIIQILRQAINHKEEPVELPLKPTKKKDTENSKWICSDGAPLKAGCVTGCFDVFKYVTINEWVYDHASMTGDKSRLDAANVTKQNKEKFVVSATDYHHGGKGTSRNTCAERAMELGFEGFWSGGGIPLYCRFVIDAKKIKEIKNFGVLKDTNPPTEPTQDNFGGWTHAQYSGQTCLLKKHI